MRRKGNRIRRGERQEARPLQGEDVGVYSNEWESNEMK